MDSIHLNITVKGKVQGVWFRASTHDKALELGLSGMVMNQSDGSVYLEAEGTKEQLDSLLSWCHLGPERAEVISVDVEEGDWCNYEGFQIVR